jgi:hypothetical protein
LLLLPPCSLLVVSSLKRLEEAEFLIAEVIYLLSTINLEH